MAQIKKTHVEIDSIPLAGSAGMSWRLVTGVTPYVTQVSVHKDDWDSLKAKLGREVTLKITDSRGFATTVQKLTILHEVPSDSPHRVSFLIADQRWNWPHKLIARDYNIPKKTGTRFVPKGQGGTPVEILVTSDEYQYRQYSLFDGKKRWTAKQAVEDVLTQLIGTNSSSFQIESWPLQEGDEDGQFTMQGVTLRDRGDAALSRLLGYIPGAEVYVDLDGVVKVIDATNLAATEAYFATLPPNTWDGEKARMIDRRGIRPREVVVHYHREVECLFEYSDDYGPGTSSMPDRGRPYLENVLPTVDPETEVSEYDPQTNQTRTYKVRQGTWIEAKQWLEAMNNDRPTGENGEEKSAPWTFKTIQEHWVVGDLDGLLGGKGKDLDREGNIAARIQALKQHFRQTFRINQRLVSRCRDILDVRSGILDPVTGARAPALVWAQCCIKPTEKYAMMKRQGSETSATYRNIDHYPQAGDTVKETVPSTAAVQWIDEELGIFSVHWIHSVYGLDAQIFPCHLSDETGAPMSPTGDLEDQDTKPVLDGAKIESGTNGLFLKSTMRMLVMMTIIPAAPNNRWQFHRVRLTGDEVQEQFQTNYRIADGDAPPMHVYVPPGEVTARFAWDDEQVAWTTIKELLALDSDDVREAGIVDEEELDGFVLINADKELNAHARAVAAEVLAPFADALQGRVATRVPQSGIKLVGNMSSASINVAGFPSGKVAAMHDFPGQQRSISRFSLLPDSARQIILGTLPFR